MDQVQLGLMREDEGDRAQEVCGRILVDPGISQRGGDGRDQLAGRLRAAAREQHHMVTAPGQFAAQLIHHALRAAIAWRWHALEWRRNQSDAQWPAGGR